MKKILTALAVLTLLIVAGSMYYFVSSSRDLGHVDALKIFAAAKSYAAGLTTQGVPIPASVSLKVLIDRGLLSEADVSGFAGLEVSVSLSANESRPQEVLVRARLPDGREIVALADGSVQQMPK